jgi:hypothetical protein
MATTDKSADRASHRPLWMTGDADADAINRLLDDLTAPSISASSKRMSA